MMNILHKIILTLMMLTGLILNGYCQKSALKQDSVRVAKFYTKIQKPLYWFSSEKNTKRAVEWLTALQSREVKMMGFDTENTPIVQLQSVLTGARNMDNAAKEKTDRQISGLVLRFIKFMHQGEVPFEYDAISKNRDSLYISQMLKSQDNTSVQTTIFRLESKDKDYLVLKKYLQDSVSDKTSIKARKIMLSMNYRRYLSANSAKEQIIVNIPQARAVYYRDHLPTVQMRVVPGTKDDPTPTMASYITSIITFPPWKVPQSIATDEILPKVQNDRNYLKDNNFVVVDAKEKEVDEKDLKWEEYDKDHFPYFFRQLPGPDNPLGVIKFNLKNPLNIYLHATNWQGAFTQHSRFLSHGCVRLEKPFELANAILRGEITREELAKVKDNIETKEFEIKRKVPTFLVYMPAITKGKKVIFLDDIYGLVQ